MKPLLLDTHVLLWWQTDSGRLKKAVRQHIAGNPMVWVSAASGWEVAIKQSLGKVTLADSFSAVVLAGGFVELPITFRHTERVTALPAHHADPFDRMIIAQAQVEAATIVTHDRQFGAYDVDIIWV